MSGGFTDWQLRFAQCLLGKSVLFINAKSQNFIYLRSAVHISRVSDQEISRQIGVVA